jgi:hypothetical protein
MRLAKQVAWMPGREMQTLLNVDRNLTLNTYFLSVLEPNGSEPLTLWLIVNDDKQSPLLNQQSQ